MTVQPALPPAQSGNDVHAHAPLRLARKLRLNQLLIVESVLQTRSFATTAQHLGMTQSAITKSMHELEAFFDAKLFERTNRGVRPTELGLALREHVRIILAEVRYMTDSLNALRLGEAGQVVIGTLTSATSRLLPDAIRTLRARHPNINVTIRVGDRSQLHDYLVDGKIDIVIGTVPPSKENQQLAYYPLYEDDLCIVAGGKHPLLAMDRSLLLEELLPYPWIVPSHESLARAKIDQMFLDAGLALPANAIESLSPITNIGLLMDQQSLTFMSGGLVELFLATGALARLDVGQRCKFGQVGYAIRSNRPTNLATQRFIACLNDEVAGFNQTLAALLDGVPPAADR